MLTRRLQTLLSVRKRSALLRLYFADTPVRFNLQTRHVASIDQRIFFKKSPLPICTTRQWLKCGARRDQIISRTCHTSTEDSYAEDYVTENDHCHRVLARTVAIKYLGVPLEKIENITDEQVKDILSRDWKDASADEVLKAFEKLSCHAKIALQSLDDDKHQDILSLLSTKVSEFSDEQLHRIYQCCLLWEGITRNKTVSFRQLLKQMDIECIKRLSNWKVEDAFLMCDYLYSLCVLRKQQFTWMVLKKFGTRPGRMTPKNFLYFMFIVSVCKKSPVNMYEIEYKFDKILDEFTANQLGIVALGFFKTQKPLRDQNILTRMQMKVLENIDTIEDISLSAIMKITRLSTGLKELPILQTILDKMKPRVPDWSLPCLVHTAHAAASVQCYDVELIELMVQRIERNIHQARLKDLERFAWALSIFNYDSQAPIYRKIADSLRDPQRANELQRYATTIPTMLLHLSNAGIFPLDLIQKSFDPEFLRRVYDNNAYKIGWDVFALESNVRTEMPEYVGPFLQEGIRQFLSKKYLVDIVSLKSSRVHPADRLILEVAHMCKLVLGSEQAIHIDHILPHFLKSDLIICLDDKNNPVEPGPMLTEIPLGTIKQVPSTASNLTWIAIVFATQNQMIRGTNQYIGQLITKQRQLQKLGYKPIVISYLDWRALPDLGAKQDFLRNILPRSTDHKILAETI